MVTLEHEKDRLIEINKRLDEIKDEISKESGVHHRTPEQEAKIKTRQQAYDRTLVALTEWRKRKHVIATMFLETDNDQEFIPDYHTEWKRGLTIVSRRVIIETNINKSTLEKLGKILDMNSLDDYTIEDLVYTLVNEAAERDPECVKLNNEVDACRKSEDAAKVPYDDEYPKNKLYRKLEREQLDLWTERNKLHIHIETVEKEMIAPKIPEIMKAFGL